MKLQEVKNCVKSLAPAIYKELKEKQEISFKMLDIGLYEIVGTGDMYKVKDTNEVEELSSLYDDFLPKTKDSMLVEYCYKIWNDSNALEEIKKYVEPMLQSLNTHNISLEKADEGYICGREGDPVYFELTKVCTKTKKSGFLGLKKVYVRTGVLFKIVKVELFNDLYEEINRLASSEGNTLCCEVYTDISDDIFQYGADALVDGKFVRNYMDDYCASVCISLNRKPVNGLVTSKPKRNHLTMASEHANEALARDDMYDAADDCLEDNI